MRPCSRWTRASRRLEHVMIGVDEFVLAGAADHAAVQQRRPASPRVLDGETVLLLEDATAFAIRRWHCAVPAGAREADLRATGLSTLVQMVAAGSGVTLLRRWRWRSRIAASSSRSARSRRRRRRARWSGVAKGGARRQALEAVGKVLRKAGPFRGAVKRHR